MSKIEQRIFALLVLALFGAILYLLIDIKTEMEQIDAGIVGVQIELERNRLSD